MMTLYKVLNKDGTPHHGGKGQWNLPARSDDGTWAPGEWMPEIQGDLEPCYNGYHLCRKNNLIRWLGPAIFVAEYRGEMVEAVEKLVVREARLLYPLKAWDERTARLFACDCAEHVSHLFEQKYPEDTRPRNAIEVARRFANGEATREELTAAWAAAGDAARDAARDAAWAAAWDAAWAAASAAARAAAGDAAWAAAGAAAGDAAWAAEQAWQTENLFKYLFPTNP